MNKSGKRYGFTLVELMVAALLAGIALIIALPLILVGRNTDTRTERKEAIALAGDAIYEYVADEMKFAGRLYLGNLTDKKPTGENWKSITVSEKDSAAGDNYARLLYGSVAELSEGEGAVDSGNPLYDEAYQQKTDLVIEAEAAGKDQLRLTVKLMDGEQALYEKTAVLSLLNLTLNAASQIEGYVGGAMTTANVPETAAEKSGGEGGPTGHLVLWYQSTKETVNPFEGGTLEGENQGEFPLTPGASVVSLANPQYVKVGETLNVQFKAQAIDGKSIVQYDWSFDSNSSEDGSPYVEEMDWDEESKKYTVKGLRVTEDGKPAQLTLVVTYDDDNNTTDNDTCDIIVYEGYKPGETPVKDFVIVPFDLEEEYKNEPGDVPVWIKKGTSKTLILDAVDKDGELTKYDVNKWGHPADGLVSYWRGFNIVSQNGKLFTADGSTSLQDGKAQIVKNDFLHYTVEISNRGVGYPYENSFNIYFGNNNETAYLPLGNKGVSYSRKICVYDSAVKLSYSREASNKYEPITEVTEDGVKEKKIQLYPGEKELNLLAELELNIPNGTSDKKIPEIVTDSINWTLDRQGKSVELNGLGDICHLEVGENEEGKLWTGNNIIKVTFKDTAGYEYEETVKVNVPSEIDYIVFDMDEPYKLLYLDDEVAGVSIEEIRFKAIGVDGEEMDDEVLSKLISTTYMVVFQPEDTKPETQPFTVITEDDGTSYIKAIREGKGKLKIELEEKISGKVITGPDGDDCVWPVEVKSLSLELKLCYVDKQWKINRVSIPASQTISVPNEDANLLRGFDAEIKLPEGISQRQRELLENYDNGKWKKVTWSNKDANLSFDRNEGLDGVNAYGWNHQWGKTGSCSFAAVSNIDKLISEEVAVTVNAAQASDVKVTREKFTDAGQLVIYGEIEAADEDNSDNARNSLSPKYRSVTLRANVTQQENLQCDKEVAWTIIKGKDLVDTDRLQLNTWVDSENYTPEIKLRNGLTDEDVGREIIVRVISRSSGISDEYRITLLPQLKIVNPDQSSEKVDIKLVHKSSSDGKTVIQDLTSMETNRDADWTIVPLSPKTNSLKFKENSIGASKVTVETQNIKSGEEQYSVKAQDRLTGQVDYRIVEVTYNAISESDDDAKAWVVKFNPNGLVYMDVGDASTIEVKGGWLFVLLIKPNGVNKIGDSTIEKFTAPSGWLSAEGSLAVSAIHPGTTQYRATTNFGIPSQDYVKIVVRGLQFKEKSYDRKIGTGTLNLEEQLYMGEINQIHWESNNPDIADFETNSGVLTLKKPGKTKITVSGYEKSAGKYTAECDVNISADWGEIKSIESHWCNENGIIQKDMEINLLAGSLVNGVGNRKIRSVLSGDAEAIKNYPVYCEIEGGNSVIRINEVVSVVGSSEPSVKFNSVRAIGAGSVIIRPAAAGVLATAGLTVNVYELDGIDIDTENADDPRRINLITGDENTMRLKAKIDPNPDNPSLKMPDEFTKVEWKVDKDSEDIIDYLDNGDGTCTVTAKAMGTAYVTCYSALNPDIYETYVVIVSF